MSGARESKVTKQPEKLAVSVSNDGRGLFRSVVTDIEYNSTTNIPQRLSECKHSLSPDDIVQKEYFDEKSQTKKMGVCCLECGKVSFTYQTNVELGKTAELLTQEGGATKFQKVLEKKMNHSDQLKVNVRDLKEKVELLKDEANLCRKMLALYDHKYRSEQIAARIEKLKQNIADIERIERRIKRASHTEDEKEVTFSFARLNHLSLQELVGIQKNLSEIGGIDNLEIDFQNERDRLEKAEKTHAEAAREIQTKIASIHVSSDTTLKLTPETSSSSTQITQSVQALADIDDEKADPSTVEISSKLRLNLRTTLSNDRNNQMISAYGGMDAGTVIDEQAQHSATQFLVTQQQEEKEAKELEQVKRELQERDAELRTPIKQLWDTCGTFTGMLERAQQGVREALFVKRQISLGSTIKDIRDANDERQRQKVELKRQEAETQASKRRSIHEERSSEIAKMVKQARDEAEARMVAHRTKTVIRDTNSLWARGSAAETLAQARKTASEAKTDSRPKKS